MTERIAELRAQAEAEISSASSGEALEELRVRHLGRKAELPQLLRRLAALEALIEQRSEQVRARELERVLQSDHVDVTLPGAPVQPIGRLHLLSATRREL